MAVCRSSAALDELAKKLEAFLEDVFWDETGDGSPVAIFDVNQVNDLWNALEAAKKAR